MNKLRWKIFKLLSHFGWLICPEPQRSDVWNYWKNDKTLGEEFRKSKRQYESN